MSYKKKAPQDKYLPKIKTRYNKSTGVHTAYCRIWSYIGHTHKKLSFEDEADTRYLAIKGLKIKVSDFRQVLKMCKKY